MTYLENVKLKTKQFVINLGAMGEVNINVRPEHSFIDVKLVDAHEAAFGDSVGLMGSFRGKLLGRDGTEMIPSPEDENTPHHEGYLYDAFAMEWQVNDKDTMLFHEIGSGPQFQPEACKLPENPQSLDNRRLSSDVEFLRKAEEACSGISNDKKEDACLYDVLATGVLDIAAYLVGF